MRRFVTVFGLAAATLWVALLAAADVAPVVLKTTEFGHGPTVVLVHGLASGRMVWMPTARKLITGHHVVMVDLPGHGDSPLPDPFSFTACAGALDAILAKQPADSTVLVAHGLAGLIALEEVKAHPDRVKGLIVIDGATKSTMKIPDQQQQYFLQMLDTNYDNMIKMMMSRQGRDSTQTVELQAQAQQVPPATVKAYIKAVLNADASSAFKGMKPAFLFVASSRIWPDTTSWGTLSKTLGYDEAGPISTHRVKDSAALIMKDQPDTLAAIIDQFSAQAIARKK